jgi:hypothetical protein
MPKQANITEDKVLSTIYCRNVVKIGKTEQNLGLNIPAAIVKKLGLKPSTKDYSGTVAKIRLSSTGILTVEFV